VAEANRHFWTRVVLVLGASATVLMLVGGSWIWIRFSHPAGIWLPPQCRAPVFLAHRSNSVEAVRAALRHGFCGIEMDVRWKDRFGLIVSHDPLPPEWSAGGSLSLPGLLDSIPQLPPLIWLDFKNLALNNAPSAAAYLNDLMAHHGLYGRIIVEARQPWALWLFYRRAARVLPAYWVPDRPTGVRGLAFDTRLSGVIGILGFSALSVPKWRLTRQFANRFFHFALFTWTCNTPEEIRTAIARGERIILTDQPTLPTLTHVSAPISTGQARSLR
jgi:hypothetical protein